MAYENESQGGLSLSALGIGLLVGAVIGAGVGLLLAPQTGRETREDLLRKYTEIRGRIRRMKGGNGIDETVPAGEEG